MDMNSVQCAQIHYRIANPKLEQLSLQQANCLTTVDGCLQSMSVNLPCDYCDKDYAPSLLLQPFDDVFD